MSEAARKYREAELTPVDDVRRVREKLSEEAENDVRRLIEQAREIARESRDRLGLKQAESR